MRLARSAAPQDGRCEEEITLNPEPGKRATMFQPAPELARR
jgi:hypothetical protein